MPRSRSFQRLSAAEAEALLSRPELRVLDARDVQSHAAGHIAGATYFGSAELDLAVFDKNKRQPVLLYCYHGNASQSHARTLADFGYAEVYDLIGGFEAWRAHLAAKAPPVLAPSAALSAWLATQGFPADDPGAAIEHGQTALMRASQLGETAIAAELLALGAPPHPTNADGNNALWLACFSARPEMIQLLIESGIDLNHLNLHGASCLMYAASSGKAEVVALLLAAGADPRLKSPDDFTALDLAATLPCLQLLRAATPRGR
ncbi:MAG: ankyrin repeat domain-containing protein [Burkholderiaceae bacterium]|nr:ankyrin repeat domain-containing protein [Burkholderiaceae bacterium]